MPTAKSAAYSQPSTSNASHSISRTVRRVASSALGIVMGLAILLPAQMINAPIVAASAGPSCQGWNSTTRPPDYIRVLRNATGRVDTVPFKKYVVTVMGKEWPSYLPQAVIDAGAVAVKQFAWFHTLGNGRLSRRGQCFDVTDGVGDQLYKPGRARVRQDHYAAVNSTWGVRLVKNGSLFMTGYRTGNRGACGHDATGWKLFARSAVRCAHHGMGYEQILRTYYGPVSVVNDGGAATSSTIAAESSSAPGGTSTNSDPGLIATPADANMTSGGGATGGVTLDLAPAVTPSPIGQRAFTAA